MTTKILSGFYFAGYTLAAPVTTLSITGSGYLDGLSAPGPGAYTVVNHGVISGVDIGANLYGATSVTNTGVIRASAVGGVALYLGNGGAVTNGAAGLIQGTDGVRAQILAARVINFGSIYGVVYGVSEEGAASFVANYGVVAQAGTAGAGVLMLDGGHVVNGGAKDQGALIDGVFGVSIKTLAGTVTNLGTILGRGTERSGTVVLTYGVDLQAGGAVVNGAGQDPAALIDASISVRIQNGAGAVTNYGVIGGPTSFFGVLLGDGGAITNAAGALIEGTTGVQVAAPSTVLNLGTIRSVYTASEGQDGIVLLAGGVVTNGAAADAAALIEGVYAGVGDLSGAASVTNFATIMAAGSPRSEGVVLDDGGVITNGGPSETAALMVGFADGAEVGGAKGTIANFGTIRAAPAAGQGAYVHAGGELTNGGGKDHAALISGFIGVKGLTFGARVVNHATIAATAGLSGSTGVFLKGGGVVVNGGAADGKAIISGYDGVEVGSKSRVTNFGTILGAESGVAVSLSESCVFTNEAGALVSAGFGVVAFLGDTVNNFGTILNSSDAGVQLDGATTLLNLGPGSLMDGRITADGGTVEALSGVATVAGIVGPGVVGGAGTLALTGYSLFGSATDLGVAAITLASGALVVVEGNVADATPWIQAGGAVSVAAGDTFAFTGLGDSFAGTLAGAGTVDLAGGSARLAATDLVLAHLTIGAAATVTLAGAIETAAAITSKSADVLIAAAGATLSGTGVLTLNAAAATIVGQTAGATLTNVGTTLEGRGRLGEGRMALVNEGKGVIDGDAGGLTLNTGARTIINAGLIEATNKATVTIDSVVANTGVLYAFGGDLLAKAAVSGGRGYIDGGRLDFASTFTGNVKFTGAAGTLELARSQAYAGSVTGLSSAGTNAIDLDDIAFGAKTAATFAGTAKSGVLTVTDGTHTARIRLVGDYEAATFVVAADGHGGTLVRDPATPAILHAFAAAAAGFTAPGGGPAPATTTSWASPFPALGPPR